jgi:hypothetical protein
VSELPAGATHNSSQSEWKTVSIAWMNGARSSG